MSGYITCRSVQAIPPHKAGPDAFCGWDEEELYIAMKREIGASKPFRTPATTAAIRSILNLFSDGRERTTTDIRIGLSWEDDSSRLNAILDDMAKDGVLKKDRFERLIIWGLA